MNDRRVGHWRFLLSLLAVALVGFAVMFGVFGDRLPPIGDGHTFLVTGQRLLEGRLDELYAPIEHRPPFTYLPQTSAYFAIFALAGIEAGHRLFLLSNLLAAWGALALMVFALDRRFASRWRLYATVSLACLPFWFIAIEQLIVGNVDFTLLLLLLLQLGLFEARRFVLQGVLLGVLVSFKPQMLLFLVLPLLHGQLVPAVAALLTVLGSLIAFYALTGSFALIGAHLSTFAEWTRHLGLQISPVSQSLRSVIARLFGDSPYVGRFDPQWFRGRELDYHIVTLPDGLVQTLSWGLPLLAGAWFFHRLVALERSHAQAAFLALLAMLPTLAPNFWQVHMVYVIPLAVGLAAELATSIRGRPSWGVAVAAALMIFASNPVLLGGRGADLVQSFGAYYFAVLAWLMLWLSRFPPTRSASYVELMARWRPAIARHRPRATA